MNNQNKLVVNVLLSLLATGYVWGCSPESEQTAERHKSQKSTLANSGSKGDEGKGDESKGEEGKGEESKGSEDATKEVASSDSPNEKVVPNLKDKKSNNDDVSSDSKSSNSPSSDDSASKSRNSRKSGKRGGDSSSETPSTSTPTSTPTSDAFLEANLTHFESYPDPGSEECIAYNGCTWAGQFAALDDKQSESWVMDNDIAAVHSKDFEKYKLKTLRLKSGSKQIDVKVYDMCSDSDCDGCCTENMKGTGFLIDLEKHTAERFGVRDGTVEWTCLDCK